MTREALWDRLKANALVDGDLPPAEEASAPWFVRLMLGVAGWIGALFLLGFAALGFSSIIDDAAGALTLGILCCAGAYILFRFTGGGDLAGQFGLAVSLAGQALIVFGLADSVSDESASLFLMVALLQAALVLLMPNVVHRVLSAFGGAVALALAMNRMGLYGIGPAVLCTGLVFIWLEPTRWARSGKLLRPAGYGLALAVLLIEAVRLYWWDWLYDLKTSSPTWLMLHGPMLGRGIAALLLLWTAHRLLAREAVPRGSSTWLGAIGGALILALLSLLAPGIAPALLVLLLGFGAGNRILVGLGILGLVGFVSHYYYSLHATLLAKSGILAATGLCLLAAHFLFRRLFAASPLPEAVDA
jgi:uncharacterized membrane protein